MTPKFRKLTWWLQRRRKEEELNEELQFHLDAEVDERRAAGLPDDDAKIAARRELGNVALLREDTRVLWTWTLVEQLAQDARFSMRALRRSPGFAAIAIVTLALGIGVNTAIFSVVNAVVLRPLPYREPATLLFIETSPLSPVPNWLTHTWRGRVRTLSDFAGFDGPRVATMVDAGASQAVTVADVSGNLLSLLGVTPALGRDFVASDAVVGGPPVAILSHGLWLRAFARDPAIIGKTVTVTGAPVTVVGVAPVGFLFPTPSSLAATGMPAETQPDVLRLASSDASLTVIGRLAPETTAAAAAVELLAIFKQEAPTRYRPALVDRLELQAVPLHDRLVGNVRQRLWLVMGAVGFVMLVACANVASLLLARASARQRELALRLALGASRGRVARLVVTESLLLALLGSAGGLLLTYASADVARILLADRLSHVDGIPIEASVLAFNIAVAVATGLLCGVVTLPGVGRVRMTAIADSGAPAVTGRSRVRQMLLSVETAITFVLVIGAALLVQTLWNLSAQSRNFDADQLLTVRVSPGLPTALDPRDARTARSVYFSSFFDDLRERLERVRGVDSAAAVSLGPLEGVGAGFGRVAVNGHTSTEESFTPVAFVTPGYFRTMRIPVVHGRDFTDGDRLGSELVAIVNEAFQRRYLPTGNILGSRVTSGSGDESFTIVGVAQDVPDRSLRQGPEPLLMAPLSQMAGVHIIWQTLTFVMRTSGGDPLRLAPAVRRMIWSVDPNIVIKDMATMHARVAVAMRAERDSALLFGLFAAAAVVMAAIGVYGVAAYTIAQRTREIGIRIALGAAHKDVRRLVVSQTFWPTLIGVLSGVAGAAMLTPLVASMVYGVAPLDLLTFIVAAVVLIGVALAATWMPARRAIRIDPLVALKYD